MPVTPKVRRVEPSIADTLRTRPLLTLVSAIAIAAVVVYFPPPKDEKWAVYIGPMRQVPLERDIKIAINGSFWVEVANPKHPFTAMLISHSKAGPPVVMVLTGQSALEMEP